MNIYKKSCDFILTTHYTELCENMEKEDNVVNMKNVTIVNNNDTNQQAYTYSYKQLDGISKINGGKQILIDLSYPDYVLDFV